MARAAQRLWRASSPLGWTSELGLAGAGPVAILAGFSLAAALELIQPEQSWAEDAALFSFCLAVAVFGRARLAGIGWRWLRCGRCAGRRGRDRVPAALGPAEISVPGR
jgi:hypothetical protein